MFLSFRAQINLAMIFVLTISSSVVFADLPVDSLVMDGNKNLYKVVESKGDSVTVVDLKLNKRTFKISELFPERKSQKGFVKGESYLTVANKDRLVYLAEFTNGSAVAFYLESKLALPYVRVSKSYLSGNLVVIDTKKLSTTKSPKPVNAECNHVFWNTNPYVMSDFFKMNLSRHTTPPPVQF